MMRWHIFGLPYIDLISETLVSVRRYKGNLVGDVLKVIGSNTVRVSYR
jgi:hypothetical protein